MQYVGINCNPRQGDTIYNYQLADNYNILLPGGFFDPPIHWEKL